jgi:D-arabinose 1-dehydrogenase-like Zn-dependent alcohol dehydrogenase
MAPALPGAAAARLVRSTGMIPRPLSADCADEGAATMPAGRVAGVGVASAPTSLSHRRGALYGLYSAGSLIGGLPETQEMLDFCAEHGIVCEIEILDIRNINEAYERMQRSDVRYRFVIDMATLKGGWITAGRQRLRRPPCIHHR